MTTIWKYEITHSYNKVIIDDKTWQQHVFIPSEHWVTIRWVLYKESIDLYNRLSQMKQVGISTWLNQF